MAQKRPDNGYSALSYAGQDALNNCISKFDVRRSPKNDVSPLPGVRTLNPVPGHLRDKSLSTISNNLDWQNNKPADYAEASRGYSRSVANPEKLIEAGRKAKSV